jgi:hypothetical protein
VNTIINFVHFLLGGQAMLCKRGIERAFAADEFSLRYDRKRRG